MFPSFGIIGRCLRNFQQHSVLQLTMVTPVWKSQPRYILHVLTGMIIEDPVLLPSIQELCWNQKTSNSVLPVHSYRNASHGKFQSRRLAKEKDLRKAGIKRLTNDCIFTPPPPPPGRASFQGNLPRGAEKVGGGQPRSQALPTWVGGGEKYER